jgi:hypothetical protein
LVKVEAAVEAAAVVSVVLAAEAETVEATAS